ncbi:radical SAM protein [Candidatus Woesearchaeota archaeon]|nr:radical SAM protein [Candidatus Woesearchaeota archaeon]
MAELVRGIMSVKGVKRSSIDTNGTLLTKQLVDGLAEAGLTRINLSLNALDPEKAGKLAGYPYNLAKVMEIARYIPAKMDLIIAPVWVPGFNDDELPKLAKFAEEIGAGKNCPAIGIQNMLNYRFGRNPVEGVPMEQFYAKMRELEQKHNVKLVFDKSAFDVEEQPELPKPFRKGQVIEAEIALPGRIGNEKLAVAKDRLISVPDCHREIGSKVKLRIRRTKHNIFLGESLD